MDKRVKNILFFFIVFTLIFNNIPKFIQMNFIGGGIVGNKLVFYPLIIGMLYTGYCHYKYKNVFVHFNKLLKFVSIYLCVTLISLVVGLYNYPYWDLITSGPIEQIDKLPKAMGLIENFGWVIDVKLMTSFWVVVRVIKGLVFEVVYTFGGSYIVYCWYKDSWDIALKILCRAICCSLAVIFVYSFIEIFFLMGNITAKNILILITPYIHSIGENGFWWPPLLWKGQLRSIFAEPSYFGIYAAFCLPFLWLMIINSKLNNKFAYIYVILTTVMTFLLFLTKARTGFMLHLGELFIFFILLIYVCDKFLLKRSIVIFLCSAMAFSGGNLFILRYIDNKQPVNKSLVTSTINEQSVNKSLVTSTINKQSVNKSLATSTINKQPVNKSLATSMSSYIDSNATSLLNPDKRSNRVRYSVMEADIKVGLERPLLGVGSSLRAAYVIDAFSEKALQQKEVKMWLDFNKRFGVLKFGIPKLGEYTSRFCETGIFGLLGFLIPHMYLIFSFLHKFKMVTSEIKVIYVVFLTSFIGILASGIGDIINITYCNWVLLGLGYAMCFGRREEKISNEST